MLELAFSVLYDPDETLNFVAPNKYEVSSYVHDNTTAVLPFVWHMWKLKSALISISIIKTWLFVWRAWKELALIPPELHILVEHFSIINFFTLFYSQQIYWFALVSQLSSSSFPATAGSWISSDRFAVCYLPSTKRQTDKVSNQLVNTAAKEPDISLCNWCKAECELILHLLLPGGWKHFQMKSKLFGVCHLCKLSAVC